MYLESNWDQNSNYLNCINLFLQKYIDYLKS